MIEVVIKWSYGTSEAAKDRIRESETFLFDTQPKREEVLKVLTEYWQLQLDCFDERRRVIPKIDQILKRKVGPLEPTNFSTTEIETLCNSDNTHGQ